MNKNISLFDVVFRKRMLCIIAITFLCSCSLFTYQNTDSCYSNDFNSICIFGNEYVARIFSPYSGNVVTHSGKYSLNKSSDTIFFNSFNKPDHKGLEIIQSYDKKFGIDSILFVIINPDSSLMYSRVEVGGDSYYIGSEGKRVVKNNKSSFVLHGWQGDFAPVDLQSDSINFVKIKYSFVDSKFYFVENSYFINEAFVLKHDTLINVKYKYILKKNKKCLKGIN